MVSTSTFWSTVTAVGVGTALLQMTKMQLVAWLQLPVPLRQLFYQMEVVEVQYLIYRLWVQLRWLSLECVVVEFHETF